MFNFFLLSEDKKMKLRAFYTLLFCGIAGIIYYTTAQAEEKNEFLETMLISEEYTKTHGNPKVTESARNILKQKKKRLDIGDDKKLKEIIKRQQQEQAKNKQNIARISKLLPAPFGLLWGETYEETLSSGVILTKTDEKDYVNSFIATQLPKPIKDMRYVVVTFGEENSLWRIISYGNFIKDKPDASLILKEYKKYYTMLEKKYGHAEETFVPKVTKKTKTVDLGRGKTKEETISVEEPVGNPNFLAQLQSGEADLYASFYNRNVGAALSVNVDGNGNSYLILEYKNLQLFQERQNQTLDAL